MRHNYMTKQIPVKYEPSAECPQWIKFLERVQPESDSRDYLQKAAGYSLTADVSEQCLFFLYGEGQNGKTTFVEVLQKLMCSYYKKTNIDTLMVKRNSAIRDDVASLAGARLVCTSEISEGQRLAEGMVKDMTGGDTLTARYLYGKEFSFKAGFKLWMYGNHKPTIGGKDDGIWRRIRLIPFEVQIPDSEKDGHLPEKLEGELSGILNWALLGCKKWRREALSAPDTIRGAVNEYRREQDTLAEFLEDCCISGGKYKVAKKLLWNAYEEWAADNEDRFDSKRSFNKEIQRRPNIIAGMALVMFPNGVVLA
jgi:putative DNA primase/helicase